MCVFVRTSLLGFISGQAWFSEGMEGDLLGVTSTGEPEYPTSTFCSGTSTLEKKKEECFFKKLNGITDGKDPELKPVSLISSF